MTALTRKIARREKQSQLECEIRNLAAITIAAQQRRNFRRRRRRRTAAPAAVMLLSADFHHCETFRKRARRCCHAMHILPHDRVSALIHRKAIACSLPGLVRPLLRGRERAGGEEWLRPDPHGLRRPISRIRTAFCIGGRGLRSSWARTARNVSLRRSATRRACSSCLRSVGASCHLRAAGVDFPAIKLSSYPARRCPQILARRCPE